jgi:hypothetical protein
VEGGVGRWEVLAVVWSLCGLMLEDDMGAHAKQEGGSMEGAGDEGATGGDGQVLSRGRPLPLTNALVTDTMGGSW